MRNHPDTEQLDMLRAGLLDNADPTRREIELHIADCPACQARYGIWDRITSSIRPSLEPAALQTLLRRSRKQALAATDTTHSRWQVIPVAAAAMLLAAISIGIFMYPVHDTARQATVTATAQMVPDTIEDLDFYLWLANQDKGNRSTMHPGSDKS